MEDKKKEVKYDSYYMPPKEEIKEIIKESDPEEIIPLEKLKQKTKKDIWKEKMNKILDSIYGDARAKRFSRVHQSVSSAKKLLEEL